ncbi:MAG: hypothetical protein JWN70_1015 [Planctomycetaceae bacterium]|nr:hypothetical protein [Planctomycetaceae bacterium]
MSDNQELQPQVNTLVFPDELNELLQLAELPDFDLCTLAFSAWLASEISNNLDLKSQSISLHATWVKHFSKYPFIGARIEKPETVEYQELEDRIGKEGLRLLHERPVIELLRFISTHRKLISDLWAQK